MNYLRTQYITAFEYYNGTISNESLFNVLKEKSKLFNDLIKCCDKENKRKRNKLSSIDVANILTETYDIHFTAKNNNEEFPKLWKTTLGCWYRLQNKYESCMFVREVLTASYNDLCRTSKTIKEYLDL